MPQPITHYLVAQRGVKEIDEEYWNQYGNFVGLGSFAPDLFYVLNVVKRGIGLSPDLQGISDLLHSKGCLEAFYQMLEWIKMNITDEEVKNKLVGFSIGFMSHAVTDCLIHPMVYRRTQDHWRDHPEPGYKNHKTLEAFIDRHVAIHYLQYIPTPDYFQINCGEEGSTEQLNAYLAQLFSDVLKIQIGKEVIAGKLVEEWLQGDTLDKQHLLNQAYEDFFERRGIWYEVGNILAKAYSCLDYVFHSDDRLSDDDFEEVDGNRESWFPADSNASLNYSVYQIVEYAIGMVKQMSEKTFAFMGDENKTDASKFFSDIGIPYFLKPYNLDTGLPCELNDIAENSSPDPLVRFSFGVDTLAANFSNMDEA